MTIRINALPPKTAPITANTQIPTEDPSDESNKTKKQSIFNLIPQFQTPWLQDISGGGKNLSNVSLITAMNLSLIRSGFVDFLTQNTNNGPTTVLFAHNIFGKGNIAIPSGHKYGRIQATAQSDTDGLEALRLLFDVSSNGSLLTALELDGLNKEVMIRNNFAFNLGNSPIINSGTLNTHTIPGGTDTFAMLAATQVLSNKTLTLPTISSFINAIHNHEDTAGGGVLDATAALDATGTKDGSTFLSGDNTWKVPPGGGESNTASNIGLDGIGVFKAKNGVDLEFKNIIRKSNKIIVTDGGPNNVVEIDVDEANLITVEKLSNKVTSVGTPGTDTNYPSEKAVRDLLDALKIPFTWSLSDEDSPLPSAASILYTTEPADKDRTITKIVAGLKNAPTANTIIIQIHKETGVNTNVFTTIVGAVEIDTNEFTSTTAGGPFVIFNGAWEEGRRLRFTFFLDDLDNAATGLKVTVLA